MDYITAYYSDNIMIDNEQTEEMQKLEMKSIILELYVSENPRDITVKNKSIWLFIRILSILMESYVKINDGKYRALHKTQKNKYDLKDVKTVFKELVEDEILFFKNRDFVLKLLENDWVDELFEDNKHVSKPISSSPLSVSKYEYDVENIILEDHTSGDILYKNKNDNEVKNNIVLDSDNSENPYCIVCVYKVLNFMKIAVRKTKKTLYEYIYAC
jgi:hypothetical protein